MVQQLNLLMFSTFNSRERVFNALYYSYKTGWFFDCLKYTITSRCNKYKIMLLQEQSFNTKKIFGMEFYDIIVTPHISPSCYNTLFDHLAPNGLIKEFPEDDFYDLLVRYMTQKMKNVINVLNYNSIIMKDI